MRRGPPDPHRLVAVAGVVASAMLAASCGAILAEVRFTDEGVGQSVFLGEAGNVAFWTDFDAEFNGDMHAYFAVELVQNGAVVAVATCDPVHIGSPRTCSRKYLGGDAHYIHCTMNCGAVLPQSGPTLVRVRFAIPGRPADLRLTRANLVVRQ